MVVWTCESATNRSSWTTCSAMTSMKLSQYDLAWLEDPKRLKDLQKSSDGENWQKLVSDLKIALEKVSNHMESWRGNHSAVEAGKFYLEFNRQKDTINSTLARLAELLKAKAMNELQRLQSQVQELMNNAVSKWKSISLLEKGIGFQYEFGLENESSLMEFAKITDETIASATRLETLQKQIKSQLAEQDRPAKVKTALDQFMESLEIYKLTWTQERDLLKPQYHDWLQNVRRPKIEAYSETLNAGLAYLADSARASIKDLTPTEKEPLSESQTRKVILDSLQRTRQQSATATLETSLMMAATVKIFK